MHTACRIYSFWILNSKINKDHKTDTEYKCIHLTMVAYQFYFSYALLTTLSIAGTGDRWINEYEVMMEWHWQGKAEVQKNLSQRTTLSTTNLHALAWVQTKASAARGQWLTDSLSHGTVCQFLMFTACNY
jgi:hypothetical protein